ncbi:hypothetical protein [Roseibium sediminis]|uniref:hypothetical protein n=1 Tax=Roseibium sediminis TaxID=1775174 RepID=UPI00123CF39B|nr:hypothetical protein [Roseibium sediminis]
MVKVRKSLTSLDEFLAAIEGYEHLDSNLLIQFLIDNYTLDLDLVPEFVSALAGMASQMQDTRHQDTLAA